MMRNWLYLLTYFTFFSIGDAIRCFECQNIPFPRECVHVVECNSNEHCFTEEVVTASGNVFFNVGCSPNLRCTDRIVAPFGKRLVNNRRSTDVVVCTECCNKNFCNVEGCGMTGIALSERGPYCYNCDALVDPRACEDVAVCLPDEVCMLYSPDDYRGVPDKIYRSKCSRPSTCQSLVMQSGLNNCSGICCSDDFCNDKCSYTNYPIPTVSTPTLPTTESTITSKSSTTTTLKPFHCEDAHYRELRLHSTKLCVHVSNHSAHSWNDARSHCQSENADLVVLDTKEKALLMRITLQYRDDGHNYWIGLKDGSSNDTLYWVNDNRLDPSRGDWDNGEPGNHSNVCVYMKSSRYLWHDGSCGPHRRYICERKYPIDTQFPYSPSFFSQAAITTSRPMTTQKPFQCEDNTYTELRHHSTKLCVHIMNSSVHNWNDSRKHCKGENADLVVLDTKEKADLMRHTLVERHGEADYWIGLEDSFLNNTLYWVNGAPLDRSQSDWDHGEPDRGTDNCVYMKRHADWRRYKWHDSRCSIVRKYICERKYPN